MLFAGSDSDQVTALESLISSFSLPDLLNLWEGLRNVNFTDTDLIVLAEVSAYHGVTKFSMLANIDL